MFRDSVLSWLAYNREDRGVLRLPDNEMRVVNGALVNASVTSKYQNALDGYARGVEWLLQRQSPNGFSGWASYALGYAHYPLLPTLSILLEF